MKRISTLLLALPFFFFSCTGEGPQGPQGAPGPPGRDATVQAFEYEVLPSAWAQAGNPGNPDFGFVALAAFPELTQDVILNAGVIGHLVLDNGGLQPLPAIIYQNGFSSNYDYILYNGEIEFWVRDSDNLTEAPQVAQYFKMVIVNATFKQMPEYEKMTIEELEAFFGITEYKKVTVK